MFYVRIIMKKLLCEVVVVVVYECCACWTA